MKVAKSIEADEAALAQLKMWEYAIAFAPVTVLKCAIELSRGKPRRSHDPYRPINGSRLLTFHPPPHHEIPNPPWHLREEEITHRAIVSIPLRLNPTLKAAPHRRKQRHGCFNSSRKQPRDACSVPQTELTCPKRRGLGIQGRPRQGFLGFASANPDHSELFDDRIACHARSEMRAFEEHYPDAFKGIDSMVDVGGGDDTAMSILVEACPSIYGINFDGPHVVSVAPRHDGIEHVGGDMFDILPKADAAFLMFALPDWSDDECVRILKKCREAIPEDKGKVIITEAVICKENDSKYTNVSFVLDMVMLAYTETEKERTTEEWQYVVNATGFIIFTVKHIQCIASIIEAYP